MAKIDATREYELREIIRLKLLPTVDTYAKAYGMVTCVVETSENTSRFGYARSGEKRFKRIPRTDDMLRIPYRLEKKFGDNYKYYILGSDLIAYKKNPKRRASKSKVEKKSKTK